MRTPISISVAAGLLAASMFASPAVAQDAALTLREAVAKAQQLAPGLQGADAALRAADANVQLAGLRPNPTLSVEAENVMGSGRYAGFGGGEKTISLSMPLELGGKRQARVRAAQADREAAGWNAKSTLSDVTLQLTEAFIALAASERRLAVDRTGRDLAERALTAARERVRAGRASPIEEQRAEVMRINADVKLGKAVRAADLARSTLARLTGAAMPLAISAEWFDHVDEGDAAASQVAPLSITTAEAEVAAALARVDAARRERTPDVTLTAGMRRFGESPDKAAILALSVPLPLFNPGTAGQARTQAEYDKAVASRNAIAQEFERSFAQAQADVADALASARAATGPALAAATEAGRIARIGYAEGKFPQLELIEAERSLAGTREAAVDALAALHTARARLARLQGNNTPIYKD